MSNPKPERQKALGGSVSAKEVAVDIILSSQYSEKSQP